MHRPHYLDPLGNHLPALERNLIRLRSMQMVLVLFYAEQLKEKVLNFIQGTDNFRAKMGHGTERVPRTAKNQVKKCLDALEADGAITPLEKEEIRRLIDYRNVIGHDIQTLVADLSTEKYIRDSREFIRTHLPTYDYEAAERLRHYLDVLDDRQMSHHYIGMLSMDGLMFTSAERTLRADIKKLKAKIRKLGLERERRIDVLNQQLKPEAGIPAEEQPWHPLNQYEDKRLTARGQEVCYRLFDHGKPPIAVAHLMRLSLKAALKRHRMWIAAGGMIREAVDLASLPRRRFQRREKD